MLRQFEILDEIVQIVFDSCEEEFDEISFEVEVNVEEHWINMTLCQIVKGEKDFPPTSVSDSDDIANLSFELHKAMKVHTGGDLKKYTLNIDGEGVASTNFEYRDQTPEQDSPQ